MQLPLKCHQTTFYWGDWGIMFLNVFLMFWISYFQLPEFSDIKYTLVSRHLPLHSQWIQERDGLRRTSILCLQLSMLSHLSRKHCPCQISGRSVNLNTIHLDEHHHFSAGPICLLFHCEKDSNVKTFVLHYISFRSHDSDHALCERLHSTNPKQP